MSKAILYVMSTIVPGLVKIGMTNDFEKEMAMLERNGYCNIVALKREYAVETDDCENKKDMIDQLLRNKRIADTDLYAVDADLIVYFFSSLRGTQVYPVKDKEEEEKPDRSHKWDLVPDGRYYMRKRSPRASNHVIEAIMDVVNGVYVIPKGTKLIASDCSGLSETIRKIRESDSVKSNTTTKDIKFASPSGASSFIMGTPSNGWNDWRGADGESIDKYRR